MARKIFITGGARSGKSLWALELAKTLGEKVLFIATAIPRDEEMKARVEKHRRLRPPQWETVEEETQVVSLLEKITPSYQAVILDCLTLYLSNLLLLNLPEETIHQEIEKLVQAIRNLAIPIIIVANEVGSGIVPDNLLARKFRDLAGWANQTFGRCCDEVYFMVAGIPLKIKGDS